MNSSGYGTAMRRGRARSSGDRDRRGRRHALDMDLHRRWRAKPPTRAALRPQCHSNASAVPRHLPARAGPTRYRIDSGCSLASGRKARFSGLSRHRSMKPLTPGSGQAPMPFRLTHRRGPHDRRPSLNIPCPTSSRRRPNGPRTARSSSLDFGLVQRRKPGVTEVVGGMP